MLETYRSQGNNRLVEKLKLVRRTENEEVLNLIDRIKGALQNSKLKFDPIVDED